MSSNLSTTTAPSISIYNNPTIPPSFLHIFKELALPKFTDSFLVKYIH